MIPILKVKCKICDKDSNYLIYLFNLKYWVCRDCERIIGWKDTKLEKILN